MHEKSPIWWAKSSSINARLKKRKKRKNYCQSPSLGEIFVKGLANSSTILALHSPVLQNSGEDDRCTLCEPQVLENVSKRDLGSAFDDVCTILTLI